MLATNLKIEPEPQNSLFRRSQFQGTSAQMDSLLPHTLSSPQLHIRTRPPHPRESIQLAARSRERTTMFTVYVADAKTSPSPLPSTCPSKSSSFHRGVDDSNAKKQRSSAFSLINTLQSSIFFGGFGSLTREMEAMEEQMAREALARSSSMPLSAVARSNESGVMSTMSSLKRYKITVQELPDVTHDGVANSDNLKGSDGALTEHTEPLNVSVTAAMPTSVMTWLLWATQRGLGGTIVESQETLQFIEDVASPVNDSKANSTITSTLPQAHASVDHDIAAATASATAAMLASPRGDDDHNAGNTQRQSENEAAVLINKVKEVQQEGGDTRTWWQRRRDARLQRDSSNQKEESSAEQEHQSYRRNWPPRGRSTGASEVIGP